MKWLALSLAVTGIFMLIVGFKMDSWASFGSGSFILEILALLAGGGLLVIGVILLLIFLFLGL